MISNQIRHVGVLTSGGDAPGMNAAIRAVVRTALFRGLRVTGVYQGYHGLVTSRFEELSAPSVANILQRGGTILKAGRSLDFLKSDVRKTAIENTKKHGIDALVCIHLACKLPAVHTWHKEVYEADIESLFPVRCIAEECKGEDP